MHQQQQRSVWAQVRHRQRHHPALPVDLLPQHCRRRGDSQKGEGQLDKNIMHPSDTAGQRLCSVRRQEERAWQSSGWLANGTLCGRTLESGTCRNEGHSRGMPNPGPCPPTLIWLQSEVGSGPPAHRGLPGFVQHRNDAHAAALAAQ